MAAMPPAWANFGIGSWIERRARIAPDQLALVGDDRSFTYAELASRVRRLANGLQRLGVGRGDRVAWLGPNHPAFLEALFASGLLGAAWRRSTTGWRPMASAAPLPTSSRRC